MLKQDLLLKHNKDNNLKRTTLKYELSLYSGILAILIIICLLIFKNI